MIYQDENITKFGIEKINNKSLKKKIVSALSLQPSIANLLK